MLLPHPTPAPVPRCSPFIIINKLAEFNNLMSDSNPYFPMPPCEYGSWQNALAKGDFRSVFVLAEPQKIPLHNFYEFIWFLKTGFPRFLRFLTGKQKFITDDKILREGYQHHTPWVRGFTYKCLYLLSRYVRTRQLGENTLRRPEIIDNKRTYKSVILDKIGQLLTRGPDKKRGPYTPWVSNFNGLTTFLHSLHLYRQGPLPGRRSGQQTSRRPIIYLPQSKYTTNFHK